MRRARAHAHGVRVVRHFDAQPRRWWFLSSIVLPFLVPCLPCHDADVEERLIGEDRKKVAHPVGETRRGGTNRGAEEQGEQSSGRHCALPPTSTVQVQSVGCIPTVNAPLPLRPLRCRLRPQPPEPLVCLASQGCPPLSLLPLPLDSRRPSTLEDTRRCDSWGDRRW